MKLVIAIVLALVTGIVVFNLPAPSQQFKSVTVPAEAYEETAKDIARRINDLSPMPPVEHSWIASEVEFAKDTAYAYVIYHDTRNIFRILLEVGQNNQYRTAAAFEPAEASATAGTAKWRLIGGQDLAARLETVKISPN